MTELAIAEHCLYVSGVSPSFSEVCLLSNWNDPTTQYFVQYLQTLNENDAVYIPDPWDVDILRLPPITHGPVIYYLQRNRASGKIRVLSLYDQVAQNAAKSGFGRLVDHPKFREALGKLGDNVLLPQLQSLDQYIAAVKNQLAEAERMKQALIAE